jgi:hypothetical protein
LRLDENLFLLYYSLIFKIKRGLIVEALETLIKLATEAAPRKPGLQIQPLYVALNLALPILLGIPLAWITKLIEKGLTRLLGERR